MARNQFQTLSEPMYYILLALLTPCYGYEIMQKITEISKGRVQVGAGTLYALLARFENEGIIKKIDAILTIYTKYVEIFSEECYNCGDKIQAALFRQGRLVSRVGAKIFGFYAVNTKGAIDT